MLKAKNIHYYQYSNSVTSLYVLEECESANSNIELARLSSDQELLEDEVIYM